MIRVPEQPKPLKSVSVPVQGNAQEGIKKALDNVSNAGPTLNVGKAEPLDRGNATNDGDDTGNHGLGAGKTPVRDLIKEVTGGGDNQKDATASTGPNE